MKSSILKALLTTLAIMTLASGCTSTNGLTFGEATAATMSTAGDIVKSTASSTARLAKSGVSKVSAAQLKRHCKTIADLGQTDDRCPKEE